MCTARSAEEFLVAVGSHFGSWESFESGPAELPTWCRFRTECGTRVELYASSLPGSEQNATLHAKAHRLLLEVFGPELRAAVRQRKLAGQPTEPAFAEALRLVGDPYSILLQVGRRGDVAPALSQRRSRRKNRRKT